MALNANEKSEALSDLSRSRGQLLIIESVRLAFVLALLAISMVFQALQPEFINTDLLFPVYSILAISFLVNWLYVLYFDESLKNWFPTAFLFFFDSAFITGLIFFTGVSQSIFLFLYLVNIILCGFVFRRKGAMVLALWTSMLFSVLLIATPSIHGQALFFAVGVNNIAFFTVAWLSGFLSEQLNFMGTELLARRKDLSALRNLQELILENIPVGMFTVSSQGEILQSNRAAREILRLSKDRLQDQNVEQILPGIWSRLNELLSTEQKTSVRFDWLLSDVDRERVQLEFIAARLEPEEDSAANYVRGYVLTFQDLTRVRELEFAMRQSEKLAAVGQLAAGIAHEIRNPLASISGSIQLLEAGYTGATVEDKKLMKIVLREIDRLNNLISEFLDFVRPEKPPDAVVDLNLLLQDILEMLRMNQALRQDIVQNIELHAHGQISGSKDKLKQALLNIIINAYQAMQETEGATITIATADVDDRVILRVRDSGCGIEEKNLKKIFEPFHTTKPKGTGLGLAVVHKIIEGHNARIFVESEKGKGTEFRIEFPRYSKGNSIATGNQTLDLNLAEKSDSKDDLEVRKRGHG